MKVRVEQDWSRRQVKIWFFEDMGGEELKLWRWDHAFGWKYETLVAVNAVDIYPSLVLPDLMARVLIPELTGLMPPNESMHEHLKDTIQVRDRLLTLVERPRVI